MDKAINKSVFSDRGGIEEALKRLNAKMVYAWMEPVELVSCGGATLNLMGLISRSTSDVDIICAATVEPGGKVRLLPGKPRSDEFHKLVADVGMELGLKQDWLNFGPAPHVQFGLPEGLEGRLQCKSFGACLTLHLISRWDQIHLKIYAAMDPNTRIETHLGDLLDLNPTRPEAEAAKNWLLNRNTSAEFRQRLKSILERIGHGELAQTF